MRRTGDLVWTKNVNDPILSCHPLLPVSSPFSHIQPSSSSQSSPFSQSSSVLLFNRISPSSQIGGSQESLNNPFPNSRLHPIFHFLHPFFFFQKSDDSPSPPAAASAAAAADPTADPAATGEEGAESPVDLFGSRSPAPAPVAPETPVLWAILCCSG